MRVSELTDAADIRRREMAASRRIRWMVRLTWLPNQFAILGLRLRYRLGHGRDPAA